MVFFFLFGGLLVLFGFFSPVFGFWLGFFGGSDVRVVVFLLFWFFAVVFVALLCRVPFLGSQKPVHKCCSLRLVIGSSEVSVVLSNGEFAIQNVSLNI